MCVIIELNALWDKQSKNGVRSVGQWKRKIGIGADVHRIELRSSYIQSNFSKFGNVIQGHIKLEYFIEFNVESIRNHIFLFVCSLFVLMLCRFQHLGS